MQYIHSNLSAWVISVNKTAPACDHHHNRRCLFVFPIFKFFFSKLKWMDLLDLPTTNIEWGKKANFNRFRHVFSSSRINGIREDGKNHVCFSISLIDNLQHFIAKYSKSAHSTINISLSSAFSFLVQYYNNNERIDIRIFDTIFNIHKIYAIFNETARKENHENREKKYWKIIIIIMNFFIETDHESLKCVFNSISFSFKAASIWLCYAKFNTFLSAKLVLIFN